MNRPDDRASGPARESTIAGNTLPLATPDRTDPTPPHPPGSPADSQTFYQAVGGHPVFERIVHRFYQQVADDPILLPLYPEPDLGPAEVRLRMFLEQYWGGPRTYSQQRGHPRLRMRHAPFVIGRAERDAWLRAMRTAIDEENLAPEHEERLWAYLVMAADSMVNSPT